MRAEGGGSAAMDRRTTSDTSASGWLMDDDNAPDAAAHEDELEAAAKGARKRRGRPSYDVPEYDASDGSDAKSTSALAWMWCCICCAMTQSVVMLAVAGLCLDAGVFILVVALMNHGGCNVGFMWLVVEGACTIAIGVILGVSGYFGLCSGPICAGPGGLLAMAVGVFKVAWAICASLLDARTLRRAAARHSLPLTPLPPASASSNAACSRAEQTARALSSRRMPVTASMKSARAFTLYRTTGCGRWSCSSLLGWYVCSVPSARKRAASAAAAQTR